MFVRKTGRFYGQNLLGPAAANNLNDRVRRGCIGKLRDSIGREAAEEKDCCF